MHFFWAPSVSFNCFSSLVLSALFIPFFQEIIQSSREEFNSLPSWIQKDVKKRAGLY